MDDCNRKSEELIEEIEGLVSYVEGGGRDESGGKRIERGLSSSEERLKILFEFAPDGIFLNDLQGVFVDGNRAAEELVGCARAELIGKSFADVGLLHEEQMPKALENLRKNAQGEPTGPDEFTLRRKDGSCVTVEIRTYPVEVDGQKLLLGIARDITQRKRAEQALDQSEKTARALLTATADLGLLIDREGRIIDLNDGMAKALRETRESMIGTVIYDYLPADLVEHRKAKGYEAERTGKSVRFEDRRGDRWLENNVYPVFDDQGKATRFAIYSRDITDRKRAEQELRASKKFSENIVETANALIVVLNGEGEITTFNRFAEELTGFDKQEVLGKKWFDLFIPEDERTVISEVFQRVLDDKPEAGTHENVILTKDGEKRLIQWNNHSVRDEAGQAVGVIGIGIDITERERAEEALRESERRFRTLSEAAFEGIAFGEKGILIDANEAFAGIYHCSLDELRGKEVMELVASEDRDLVKNNMLSGYEGVYEHRGIRKDGSVIDLEVHGRSVKRDGRKVRLTAIRDVTERKRAERELEERLRFETLIAKLSAKFVNLSADEVDREINEGLRRIVEFLGVDRGGFLQFSEDKSELSVTHTYAVAGMEPVPVMEVTNRFGWLTEKLGQGETICISRPDELPEEAEMERKFLLEQGQNSVLMTPLKVGGSILGVLTIGSLRCERSWSEQTISRVQLVGEIFANALMRQRAENALRQSEEHYRAIVEDQTELICRYLADFTITFANEAYCRYFGKTREELIGRKFVPLIPEEDHLKVKEHFASLGPDNLVATHEHRVIDRDGQMRWQQWTNRTILDDAGDIVEFQGTGRDITERKQAEAKAREHQSELAHVWRVNTMGEMASGLAHELNQPLCAILNYANACLRMMKKDAEASGELVDPVERIASQADRAGEIIKRIRGLVAKRKPQTSPADINGIVREVVEMEKAEASHKEIIVRTELAEDLPSVLVDRVEIEEVILNLVRNAFDAMSDPSIERREVTIATCMTEDGAVEVCVRDTGKGFAILGQQIFDSFFTTKIDGLGIGLSISRTIVESHGGKLWAEQNPDCGASFRFTLPVKCV